MEIKRQSFESIDEYIYRFPSQVQTVLNQIRAVIKEEAPEAKEKISYQMPTFFLNGNLVHFAVHKNHIGFYPTPSGIRAFQNDFSNYTWSKGAVQFPLDEPVPYDLIRRIVRFRVSETMTNKAKPNKRLRE
ncbi:MAG: DUF1801 domain-containing protein [Chitinivibrionales bacterium]|nr:DUF1801 domain-containing protein [Chitinivibrionales bacterium]